MNNQRPQRFMVHHAGKNGDLVYALPVIKALARERGEKITLVTSGLCYQIVPLLYEQPFIEDVIMDYSRSYKIERGSIEPWAILSPEEGINLSPQPSMYRPNAPIPWTLAYAEIAGIKELTLKDRIALPTLWNQRQWYWEHKVESEAKDGPHSWSPPRTVVLAPESQTLKCIPLWAWVNVAKGLRKQFHVIVVGEKAGDDFPNDVIDLRGKTTVSSMARFLAEAHLVISANSLPWHLARHAGTPTFCFQDQYLERCVPVDTPYAFYRADQLEVMVKDALLFAEYPRTTLWKDSDIQALMKAA